MFLRFAVPFALLFLAACHTQPDAPERAVVSKEPFPYLRAGGIPPAARPLSATWQAETAPPVWYIGPLRDTLRLPSPATAADSLLLRYAVHEDLDETVPRRSAHWPLGYSARMSLALDTTRRLAAEERFNAERRADSAHHWFAAHPVLLRNRGRDTVRVGPAAFVPLHVEAQDALGEWRVIEAPRLRFCGVGDPVLFLPPGQVVLTAVHVPHGPFATRVRVRYGHTASAPFAGRIDPRQFTSPYNGRGEYHAAYLLERPNRRP